jgi:hypothetical protein
MMSVEEKPSVTHAEHLLASDSQQSTWKYLSSRVTTLKPTFCKTQNPIKVLGQLDRQQWLFFWVYFKTASPLLKIQRARAYIHP